MANFESFHWVISSIINIFFLKSEFLVLTNIIFLFYQILITTYRFKRPEQVEFDPNVPCELEEICDVTEKNYPL